MMRMTLRWLVLPCIALAAWSCTSNEPARESTATAPPPASAALQ